MSCFLEASIESRLWGTPSHLHPFLPGATWPSEAPYTWADPHYHPRSKTSLILTGHQSVNQNYSKRRKEVKFWLELRANILVILGVFLGVRRIPPRLRRRGLLIQTRNRDTGESQSADGQAVSSGDTSSPQPWALDEQPWKRTLKFPGKL